MLVRRRAANEPASSEHHTPTSSLSPALPPVLVRPRGYLGVHDTPTREKRERDREIEREKRGRLALLEEPIPTA